MKILEKDDSTAVDAFEILSEYDESELNHIQRENLEFLRKNLKIKDKESFEELKKELSEVDSLKEKHVIKLLELLPTHEKEVKTILSKERIKLEDAEVENIIDICQSYKN